MSDVVVARADVQTPTDDATSMNASGDPNSYRPKITKESIYLAVPQGMAPPKGEILRLRGSHTDPEPRRDRDPTADANTKHHLDTFISVVNGFHRNKN